LAASVYPRKTIVRMSDFKSNENANLGGGRIYDIGSIKMPLVTF